MRNIKYIILFICLFILVGCEYKYASTTRTIRHSGFNVTGTTFVCDSIFDEDGIKDKVKFYENGYMITESGKIYEISLGKKYSNNMNCMKADFSTKVTAIFDTSVVKGSDGYYYYLSGDNVTPYTVVTSNDERYNLYNLLLNDANTLKVSTVDGNGGIYYVLKTDGNIYKYYVSKVNNTNEYVVDNIETVYSYLQYGQMVDFNYNGSNVSTYIKSDKGFYRMKINNLTECSKYADVACKYEFGLDDELSGVSDDILAYNGSSLITSYGRVFSVSN